MAWLHFKAAAGHDAPDGSDRKPDETPETPLDEPPPPRVDDPPSEPEERGPYVVEDGRPS
jgi:hypothetical protein